MEAVHSELGMKRASMHMQVAQLVTQALITHLSCTYASSLDHTYVWPHRGVSYNQLTTEGKAKLGSWISWLGM